MDNTSKSVFLFYFIFSQWQHVETIELVNDGTGLGFGIVGGKTTGVIVKTIIPGGVADQVIALVYFSWV